MRTAMKHIVFKFPKILKTVKVPAGCKTIGMVKLWCWL